MLPHFSFSQRATCPPSAAVRQFSIADITLSWPRLTWPGIGLAPRRSMAAEDIRNLQLWTCQERRALGGQLDLGLVFSLLLGRVFGLVLLGPQRREAIERAHDLADRVGGDPRVERRGVELGVTQRSRVIMRTFL